MATLRNGAPKKNMFGSIRRCDAVWAKQCPNRATITLVPTHVPGANFTLTYFCSSHAPEVN